MSTDSSDATSTDLTQEFDLQEAGRRLLSSRLPLTSTVTVVKPLTGGYTDAQVLLCDVASDQVDGGIEVLNGQFILKIGRSTGRSQAEAHKIFCRNMGTFADAHVPKLLMSVQDAGLFADLYDIAGYSLKSVRTAELCDYEDREDSCACAATDLLIAQLAAEPAPDYGWTVGQVVQNWLGDNFPDNGRGMLIKNLVGQLGITGKGFLHEGELLPNPLTLLRPESPLASEILPCFLGSAHGDLHLRNILVRGSRQTRDLEYWLIDVNWREPAPLLYDQAYLEISAFLNSLPHSRLGRVLPLLGKIDGESLVVNVELDLADSGPVRFVREIRQRTTAVLADQQKKRQDVWRAQYLLARIAAGLNWAAKPLNDINLQRAAFLGAAWATRQLLRSNHEYAPIWLSVARETPDGSTGAARIAAPISAAEAINRWAPFRAPDSGMDLFLVTDGVAARDDLVGLAHCRWAAVLDLDPDSDGTGIAKVVVPALRTVRHVSVFGGNKQLTPPAFATNWLMANGWTSRNENAAASSIEWRRMGYPARVRNLVDEVHEGTPYRAAAVLCLRSDHHDDLVDRVVEYIDEKYEGLAFQLDLAAVPTVAGVDVDAFLAAVTASLPSPGAGPRPTIPGLDGWHVLSRVDLCRLEVDLDVLHSEVLSESLTSAPATDEFWRGRPPTWGELEALIDVPRDSCSDLLKDLRERLDDHQMAAVYLHHSPGAGGTTLARRVAWNLHRTYPTVLLRNYTATTVERIDEIYQRTGRAVLVVAEAADLPESDLDELTHELLQRNSRAVMLWIKRTNAGQDRQRHKLFDPVSAAERERFMVEYQHRATTKQARDRLAELVTGDLSVIPQQLLSPFYFGLCVYDSKFGAIDSYVRNHLTALNNKQREVARCLALTTRYAQPGIPTDLVRRWLDGAPPRSGAYGDAELREILGPDLRHLVVAAQDGLRLLHPLIAEHVLAGDSEHGQLGLAQISVDFIRKVTEFLGPDNRSTLRILHELFVRRNVWNERLQRQEFFSELIEGMPTYEAGELVFEELTKRCPKAPHFWNHRGRYHIYRLKGDFSRPEKYLLRAVEESGGRDSIHLHTLGMVLRFWIESKLKELAISGAASTPEQILADVQLLFDRAMEAFRAARLYSMNEHAWVTPIQLISYVVEWLIRASNSASLAEFLGHPGPAAEWVARQLDHAEALLEELRLAHAERRSQSRYHELCGNFDVLYGDIDGLVERWRELREDAEAKTIIGLALARTLYARARRDWSQLSENDLREVVEMVFDSVRSGQATDTDLRLWFQAYRRLPEYSETEVLERFGWFASERHSLEANYYLYILHFLMWNRGDRRDQNRVRVYLEECKKLSSLNRRQLSYEWLGNESGSNNFLVHVGELGERRLEYDNFWTRPNRLRRVSGIIEDIKGPQAGSIKIGNGELVAFFVPRHEFLRTRDINQAVEFYLGFSYEGFRAWAVTYPGVKPKALQVAERHQAAERAGSVRESRSAETPVVASKSQDVVLRAVPPARPTPSAQERQRPRQRAFDPARLRGIVAKVRDDTVDYEAVITELVLAARDAGQPLTSLRLGEVLQASFGKQSYDEFRGAGKLRGAVERLGFHTTTTPSGFIVELP